MNKFKPILLVLFLCMSFSHADSQVFKNYTTIDGLPDDYISGGIAIDQQNNIWFGTAAGVAKYDNSKWTVYTKNDGLIDNSINCIEVDDSGYVWVGTDFGVSRFDGTKWTSFTKLNGLADNTVYYIANDIDGSIWFATFSGASKYNGTSFSTVSISDGMPSNLISCIAVDSFGNKWFGSWTAGVIKYDGTNFTQFTTDDSLADNNISSIAFDRNGNKWIGTYNGISVFDKNNKWVKNITNKDGLLNNFVRDIKIDSKGNIWAGVYIDYLQEGGVSKFNGTNWKSYETTDGLVNEQVERLCIDQEDNIWIATGLGVSKLTDTTSGLYLNQDVIKIKVFPNPATDILFIHHKNPLNISIIDMTGKTIKQEYLSIGQEYIDIENIASGFYVIRILDETRLYHFKIEKK